MSNAKETLKAFFVKAAKQIEQAQEEARIVDGVPEDFIYDPNFILHLNLETVELDDKFERFDMKFSDLYPDFDFINEITDDEAERLLAAECWRWYGDDGYSGDNADSKLYLIGEQLDAALTKEVEAWKDASVTNYNESRA